MITVAVGLLAIVTTGYLYVKWAKHTFANIAEDLWHQAFDALLNP